MKKSSILILLVALTFLVASCKSTPVAESITPTDSEVSAAIVETPGADIEQFVISDAPAMDPQELTEKFSYIYGYLLADSLMEQGITVNTSFFAMGAEDFAFYLDLRVDMDEINEAFVAFQDLLDGVLDEELFYASPSDDPEMPSSIFELFSYGYGYLIMYNLELSGIEVEMESYNRGIVDAYSYVPLPYTSQQIDDIFLAYQNLLMESYNEFFAAMAAESLALAEQFLAENSTRDEVQVTASGLQYVVKQTGTGPVANFEDQVVVDYLMTFMDGTPGDSSYERGEPTTFAVSNLIPGFIEGLSLMNAGSYYTFYVHPDLAYGPLGNEMIPPNSLLIFEVELHEIIKP